jgi:hypothetical protein
MKLFDRYEHLLLLNNNRLPLMTGTENAEHRWVRELFCP